MTDLQRAVVALGAVRSGIGRYAYYADEISSAVELDSDDLRDYGARLRRGDADAYSHWCRESYASRLSHDRGRDLGLE